MLMLVGCLVLWLPDFSGSREAIEFVGLLIPHWLLASFCLLLTIGCGMALSTLFFYAYATRTRSLFTTFLYLLTVSSLPELHCDILAQVSAFVYILLLGSLMSMYKNPRAVTAAYNVGLLFPFLLIFQPVFLLFVPCLWVTMMVLRAFSLRTWLASVLGLLTTYVFATYWCYLTKIDYWIPWKDWHFEWMDNGLALWMWLLWSVFMLGITLQQYSRYFSFSIKNRILMHQMLILGLVLLGLTIATSFSSPILVCCVISWLFFLVQWSQSDTMSRFSWVNLVIYVLLMIAIYICAQLGYGMA